ncbi:aromatic ring-hydroxylating dioxygenase subunit alpha [Gammaproteobacteria bacterium]|nr:aromatic ring-hydroxylating dioxygenase subunit alpha [Gammaproteobacteria bacterium]
MGSFNLNDFLSPEVIDKLRDSDLNLARGLPASIYTSPDFFKFEKERLFPESWVGIGFESDVSEVGDAVPMEVGGLPLVLCRDNNSQIQVLHNVCRHRATMVLESPASGLKNFKCPYHGWVYDLDGSLLATPFWDGTAGAKRCPVEPESASLVPVRSAVWNHIVFVNLSGNAPSLDSYLAEMEEELGHFDLESMEVIHSESWVFNANWKLVMENWEVYHHVWVHQGVFDLMSDEVDLETGVPCTDMIARNNSLMLRPNGLRKESARPNPVDLPLMPWKPDIPRTPKLSSIANAILPNVTASMGRVEFAPAVYIPIAPDKTLAKMAWFIPPGIKNDEKLKPEVDKILERWLGPDRSIAGRRGIRAQDHRCMELQQQARSSPVASDVRFSRTWEANVRYFQNWLVERLQA